MVSQFQKANQLQRSGKLEEAVIAYRQAIAQNPDFYWSYHNLGETLCKLERLDEAVEAYQKAVALKPSAACSHLNLAEVLEQQGKEKEAIACYRQAAQLNPQFEQQYKSLEKLLRRHGKKGEADGVFQQAVQLSPKPALLQKNGDEVGNGSRQKVSQPKFQAVQKAKEEKYKQQKLNSSQNQDFYSNLMKHFRDVSCKFEELDFLLRFPYQTHRHPTLVDVGAHVGYVSRQFAEKGWKIIAFEPEPENRNDLEKNLKKYKDVTIIPKAVSNQDDQSVTFYVSSEHWGIHSLKPFHKTHQPNLTVETIRLDTALRSLKVKDVSLLKVDTEGADFLVLQSFDFNQVKPEIVMCEFADDRSIPNFGCSHHDIAQYMRNQGYEVFISEWASVTEYGRKGKRSDPHYFLQCTRYPINHEPAWGNLIFVRNDRVTDFEKTLSSYIDSFYTKRETIILQSSNRNLVKYKDRHKGDRCVIIGNGSSLNKMDLSFLKNEITFGLNKIFLGFEKFNFVPTYYVAVNRLVIEQSANQICNIPCTKFISNRGISYLKPQEDMIFLKSDPHPGMDFSDDPTQGLNEGSTVTYVALQLAYYMGFKTVILIGVDHHFVTQGIPHTEVVSQEDDPNHFHPEYFGKGTKWQLPDLKTSERYYKIAYAKFWLDSRKIIDATLGGKCPVFPKKRYRDLFFS